MSGQYDNILENLQQRFPMAEAATDNNSDSQLVVELLLSTDYQNPTSTPLTQSIVAALKQHKLSLSSLHYATLSWAESFYSNLLTSCGFGSSLGEQLLRLTPAIAARAITDSQFFTPQQHPLHSLGNQLCDICTGWHQDLGRTGQNFVKQVGTLVEQIISELSNSQIDYEALSGLLKAFESSLNARIKKLEKRAIAAEMGKLKAKHAKEFVAKALNEQLQSAQLPLSIQQVLQSSWCDSLQLIYLRRGSDSPQWSAMIELANKLIWTLQPAEVEGEDLTQRLYKMIPQVTREFRKSLVSIQHNNQAMSGIISAIEEQHVKVLKGEALEYDNYQPLSVGSLLGNTSISSSLLEAIDLQQVGQWYALGAEGKRIKLALKEQQQRQLLFVNQAGLTALDRNYEEFAYLLTSGEIKQLNFSTVFTDNIAASLLDPVTDKAEDPTPVADVVLDEGYDMLGDLSDDPESALPLPEVKISEEPMDFEQYNVEEIEATLPLAELEEDSSESPPSQKETTQMPLGCWVRFLDKDPEIQARLVACVGGDRHIFVNQAGFRQREASTQELADLAEKNLFEVTDAVSDFAQTIQVMVNKLRGNDNWDIDSE